MKTPLIIMIGILLIIPIVRAGVVPLDDPSHNPLGDDYEWVLVETQNITNGFGGVNFSGTCSDVQWIAGSSGCDLVSATSMSYGDVGMVLHINGDDKYRSTYFLNSSIYETTWIVEMDVYLSSTNRVGILFNNRTDSISYFDRETVKFDWDSGGPGTRREGRLQNTTAGPLFDTINTNFTSASDNAWHTITWEYYNNGEDGMYVYTDGSLSMEHLEEHREEYVGLMPTGLHAIAGGWSRTTDTYVGNVTVYVGTTPAADPCLYGGSGDHTLDCSANLQCNTGQTLLGNDLILNGVGEIVLNADMTEVGAIYKDDQCIVYKSDEAQVLWT